MAETYGYMRVSARDQNGVVKKVPNKESPVPANAGSSDSLLCS